MINLTKIISTIVLASVLLTGCNPSVSNKDTSEDTSQDSSQSAKKGMKLSYDTLRSYDWELVNAKTTDGDDVALLQTQPEDPLVLSFLQQDGNNILALNNTCNTFFAPYTVKSSEVNVGEFAGTKMACQTTQANFDAAATKAAVGKYSLSQDADGEPMMTVVSNEYTASFKAIPKLEGK